MELRWRVNLHLLEALPFKSFNTYRYECRGVQSAAAAAVAPALAAVMVVSVAGEQSAVHCG
jgi:hypothetical protein